MRACLGTTALFELDKISGRVDHGRRCCLASSSYFEVYSADTRIQHCNRLIDSGEVLRGEKMLDFGTDPESYITEYTLLYEEIITQR